MNTVFKTTLVAALMTFGAACGSAEQQSPDETPVSSAIPVEVVRDGARWILVRGGEPYVIKGAGISDGDVAELAARGGNSFRNWRDFDSPDGLAILDEAARHGVTVAMCLPIGRERHGFDYDDPEAVAQQFEFARSEVLRYKDHPALLLWGIGNEMEGFAEGDDAAVWSHVQALAAKLGIDEQKLRQVLLNLVINAIKFTDSGRIDIEALPPTTPGCSVRFEVNDTGIGILKAYQARIFEPFFSAGAGATPAQEKGTGLGLDIVRRNTEAMGGRVGVSSAPGSGSTFWIELPRAQEAGFGTDEPGRTREE